jgi:hypothetical protein
MVAAKPRAKSGFGFGIITDFSIFSFPIAAVVEHQMLFFVKNLELEWK